VSIRLIVEVLDHAPADLTPSERLVLVVVAEGANDETREGWPGMDKISSRTGLQPDSVRRVLQRLAKRGIEIRVPIGKDKRGRLVFAHEGSRTRYRIPVLAPKRRDEDPTSQNQEAGRQSHHSDSRGGTVVPQRRDADPSEAGPQSRPFPQSPQSPHLSLAEQVVRDSGVVAEHERETFISWLKDKYAIRGIGWWKTVTPADLAEHAADWRAQRTGTPSAPTLPPWCGQCGDRQELAKKNPDLRLVEDDHGNRRPCPDCHPNNVRNTT
jgi:DNA-binding MarR family transcriptional regulator